MSIYDDLRRSLDVKAVAQHLGLRRRGVYVKCPRDDCPSHKKGRLTARSLEGARLGCLACGQMIGDSVDLIQLVRGCSRDQAMDEARDLAGMPDFKPEPYRPEEAEKAPADMEQRVAALNAATEHYHRILTEGVAYLHGIGVTGIDDETHSAIAYVHKRGFVGPYPVKVGIVPSERTGLANVMPAHLREAAVRAGVLAARGNERLAGRIWLPWTDGGATVSYKARAIDGLCTGRKWAGPRTTPNGKGLVQMPRPSVPFGADAAALLDGTWAVAEAELDALALLVAGVPAVAVGGTSGVGVAALKNVLPEDGAALLYDSDAAGKAGAEKQGRRLGIPWATMPGADPADVLKMHGGAVLRKTALDAIASARTAEEKRAVIVGTVDELCTDQGTARRFVAWAEGRILFLSDRDRWAVYDAGRWVVDSKHAPRVEAKLEQFLETEIAAERDERRAAGLEDDAETIDEWRLRCMKATGAADVLKKARVDLRCQSSMEDFDQHHMLLNCTNGTVNLETGEMMPHDPAHRLMQMAGCAYRPRAQSDLWDDIVDKVMCGNKALSGYLRRALGYTITGHAGEECFWFHYGPKGRNGKGTVFGTIQDALGDYQQSADAKTFIRKRFASSGPTEDVAELAGRRAIFASEWDRGQHLDEGLIKNLTGQDIVRARFLNEGGFQFRPIFKLHISTNYLPNIGGQDGGIWERVLVLRWDAHFGVEDRDPDLKRKLREPEHLEAVLAWLVDGCMEYQQDGLRHPGDVVRWTEEYRENSDVLGEWLEDRTDADATAWTSGKALYANYCEWCEAVHERPIGRKSFTQALVERGFPRARNPERTSRGHSGLHLRASSTLRVVR